MDPSRIYGFVSLVDPQSGQMHLDKGYPDASGKYIPSGRPEYLNIVFRLKDGSLFKATFDTRATLQKGFAFQMDAAYQNFLGLRYDIHLRQLPGSQTKPQVTISSLGFFPVDYDSDIYQFQSVEMGRFIFPDPNGSIVDALGNKFTAISLLARQLPFALPNF